ncbi:transposase (fragment) [Cupriavidus taiwanensis]|uniref:Transposase n=1 Tax=Cupriavidus taiwanensis TaxID=164546 RepID=A0A375JF04_9BURK
MPNATAASALAGFTAKLQSLVAPLRQTLTYDQGGEMARHGELSATTGVRVYFCEKTNGLLRQYLPKGTDLSVHSQEDLDAIADSFKTRPRKTLTATTHYKSSPRSGSS